MRLPVSLAGVVAALCAFFVSPASAAGPLGVYTVANVRVDVSAPDASQARNTGFAAAQKLAFDRLVRRLTIPDELARLGAPQLAPSQLDQLISGVDIGEERRSGTRYLARVNVNFDPSATRKVLRDKGLTVIDTRTAPVIVVPVMTGAAPELQATWRQAWDGFAEELVPVALAPPELTGAPDWTIAEPFAAAAGATTAIYATARIQGGSAVVELVEVGAGGISRPRGSFTTPVVVGEQGFAGPLGKLAEAANGRIQNEWKVRLATGSGQRAKMEVSALYDSQTQWARLKKGLEGAAATVLSEIQIKAVGKGGAMLSFSYVGTADQLAAELRRNGVAMEQGAQGTVLRVAGGG